MLSSQDKPIISDQILSSMMILDCPPLMSDSVSWNSHQQGIRLSYKISSAHWYSLVLTCLENLVIEQLNTIFSEFLVNISITCISLRNVGWWCKALETCVKEFCSCLASRSSWVATDAEILCQESKKNVVEGITGPSCLPKAEQTIWCHSWQVFI